MRTFREFLRCILLKSQPHSEVRNVPIAASTTGASFILLNWRDADKDVCALMVSDFRFYRNSPSLPGDIWVELRNVVAPYPIAQDFYTRYGSATNPSDALFVLNQPLVVIPLESLLLTTIDNAVTVEGMTIFSRVDACCRESDGWPLERILRHLKPSEKGVAR